MIPDNEKAAVREASRYEPDLNPTYQELAIPPRRAHSRRGDGSYPKLIQRLARTWLLILDDLGLASLSGQGRHDLPEVLDDRYARRDILLASQIPIDHWHDVGGDPTFGDAILDRLPRLDFNPHPTPGAQQRRRSGHSATSAAQNPIESGPVSGLVKALGESDDRDHHHDRIGADER